MICRFLRPSHQYYVASHLILQVVVALPLVIITTMCVATHLIVDNLLGNALVPVSSYEETFRVQALLVEVREQP